VFIVSQYLLIHVQHLLVCFILDGITCVLYGVDIIVDSIAL
jgi:hypothetical protein